MRISPITANYNKVLPKTAKKFVSNPMKTVGLLTAGVAVGMLCGKNQPKTETLKKENTTPKTVLVTKEDIKKKLISLGYKEEDGVLWKESDKEEKQKLRQKYGFLGAGYFKNVLHKPLADEERIEEIAKMLSGDAITEAALAQAKHLLSL